MVSAKDIRLSNNAFKARKKHITAVFVGGTGGVGKGTLLQLAKHAYSPTVYIIGRSEKSAMPLLDELNHLNPEGKYVFIETDVSLIKNVDKVSQQIKSAEQKLDLLFMSPGYLSLGGRNGTPFPNASSNNFRHLRGNRHNGILVVLLASALHIQPSSATFPFSKRQGR